MVVFSPEIHFGEYLSSFELINELEDEREGVIIFNHMLIQIMVILYYLLFLILFGYEEHG